LTTVHISVDQYSYIDGWYLVIEQEVAVEKNIYELNEFHRSLKQLQNDKKQRETFYTFKHIYLIQNDFRNVKEIEQSSILCYSHSEFSY
jgi:predicted Zn-dependent protease